MNYARARRCNLIMGALFLSPLSAKAAPDPAAILKRAQAVMNSLKSYQATVQTTTTVSSLGSATVRVEIKMIPARGKMCATTSPVGTPTGQIAAMAALLNVQLFDDGNTLLIYRPTQKNYSKRPHVPHFDPTRLYGLVNQKNATFKFLRTEQVGGKPTYVIRITPQKLPRGLVGSSILYIDQTTYRIRQAHIISVSSQPPRTTNITIVVKNDTVNAPIPDSAFTFTPPPGVKEIKSAPLNGLRLPKSRN